MNLKLIFVPLFVLFVLFTTAKGQKAIHWNLGGLVASKSENRIAGNPKIIGG